MRILLQRVLSASVKIDGVIYSSVGKGMLIFVGIEESDQKEDIEWLVKKITALRIFSDDAGKMNLDIRQVNGEFLVVSQFTLHAQVKRGTVRHLLLLRDPKRLFRCTSILLNHLKLNPG